MHLYAVSVVKQNFELRECSVLQVFPDFLCKSTGHEMMGRRPGFLFILQSCREGCGISGVSAVSGSHFPFMAI